MRPVRTIPKGPVRPTAVGASFHPGRPCGSRFRHVLPAAWAKSERGGTFGSSRSSGENRDLLGPASRSGVLGSGCYPALGIPIVRDDQDSVPAPVTLDDDARSHPAQQEVRCPRFPFTHRTHHGPGANSGPRGQPVPHGHRHCPPDGKRPPHHPVSPSPITVMTELSCERDGERISPLETRGITLAKILRLLR